MKLATNLLVALLLLACGRGGEMGSYAAPVAADQGSRLCVSNETGGQIHVYTQVRKVGVIATSTECVALTIEHFVGGGMRGIVVFAMTAEPNVVALPDTDYESSPYWSVRMGPWPNRWSIDAYSLKPSAGA